MFLKMYSRFKQNLAFSLVFTFLQHLLFCSQMGTGSRRNFSSSRCDKLDSIPLTPRTARHSKWSNVNSYSVSLLLNKHTEVAKPKHSGYISCPQDLWRDCVECVSLLLD